jgi:hypothetical protein
MNDVFVYNNGLRFLDKDVNLNERNNYRDWWIEQISQYGIEVDYYSTNYSLSGHDALYGEEPTQKFSDPKKVILALTLQENAIVLQKFGLVADDEVTGFIPIKSYEDVFGVGTEPKSDDVFDLTEFGSDRPSPRGGKKFVITERLEQEVSQINPLMGHYVWLIRAKRFDYSFEPGIDKEPGMDEVYDDTFAGRLAGGENTKTDDKSYTDSIDEDSAGVFDYSLYGNNDDVYGDYR